MGLSVCYSVSEWVAAVRFEVMQVVIEMTAHGQVCGNFLVSSGFTCYFTGLGGYFGGLQAQPSGFSVRFCG